MADGHEETVKEAIAADGGDPDRPRRRRAALGTALFLVVAPGIVAGVGPWLVSGWQFETPFEGWLPFRLLGGALIAAGAVALLHSFARFVSEGLGTPAPVAPTRTLVVGGLYRYLRNPMYVAVGGLIVGQALLFGRLDLLIYAVAFFLLVAAFVRVYEEPLLAAQFGAEYEAYRRGVPGWWPRRTPWRPQS